MQVLERSFRVYADADDLDRTVAFYERIQGIVCERRVPIPERNVVAAKVGAFLILAGSAEALAHVRHVVGILYVRDLDGFAAAVREGGGEIIHGPLEVTGGRNFTARHPDGLVLEYFEALR